MLELAQQPVGMIRQLEHRVGTLDELHARLDGERHAALREAQRARDTLAGAFKHADALQATQSAVKRIKAAMAQPQHPPARALPTSTTAAPAVRRDATRAPVASEAQRAATVLGQDRADRLKRAQAALTKRFTGPPAGNKAPRCQDPQALYWHRRLTSIMDAARRLPADRSEFAHESNSDLRQLADEALRGARAAYTAGTLPRAGSAHHAAHPALSHAALAWPPGSRDSPQIDR